MVHEKAKSGDPDHDDKQPLATNPVVSAGDGVFISPSTGPVDASGAHVNLDEPTGDEDIKIPPKPARSPK